MVSEVIEAFPDEQGSLRTLRLSPGNTGQFFIQELLGHADVGTTEIYTRVSIAKLREIHRATHPARWGSGAPDGDQESGESERIRAWRHRTSSE